MYDKTGNIHS